MAMQKMNHSLNEMYNLTKIIYTGKGVCAAVLDTGLYPHTDLKNSLVFFKDFINKKTDYYDDNSHGTHVCGIVAGSGISSSGKYRGMAPACHLAALKILNNNGRGDKETLFFALRWLRCHHKEYNIKIVNISIGAPTRDCLEERCEITEMINELWDEGLCIVASAGNEGPGAGTITFPGSCENVITVGSLYPKSRISGEGPTKCNIRKPDIIAPGTSIISCNNRPFSYASKSGTSMSTPIVSGAIALFLEKYPNASNTEIKNHLKETSTDLFLRHSLQGAGLLNLDAFLFS